MSFVGAKRYDSLVGSKSIKRDDGNHATTEQASVTTQHHRQRPHFGSTKPASHHGRKSHPQSTNSFISTAMPTRTLTPTPTLSPALLSSTSLIPSPVPLSSTLPTVLEDSHVSHVTAAAEEHDTENRGTHLLGPLLGGLGGLAILVTLILLLLRRKQSQKRGWNVTSTSLNRHHSWSTTSTQMPPPPAYSPKAKRWTADTLVDSAFTQYAPQLSYKALHPSHYSFEDIKKNPLETSQDVDEKVKENSVEAYQPQLSIERHHALSNSLSENLNPRSPADTSRATYSDDSSNTHSSSHPHA